MNLIPFPARLLRTFFIATILTFAVVPTFGQATAIEPCPAPAKPGAISATPAKIDTRARRISIDDKVPDDGEVEKILSTYTAKVRALSVVIGKLEGDLKKTPIGAGTLGNFVADGMRAQAAAKLKRPVSLSIMNAGGLRKNEISPGELRASDIFELLPFENALIAIDFTGAQLQKILQLLTREAQSGAKIQFKYNEQNRTEFLSAKLLDENGREVEIDPARIYTMVTIDYLVNLNSGTWIILQEGTNRTPLNITLRDSMMDYVKSETAAGRTIKARTDDRYVQVGPGPNRTETPND